MKKGRQKKRSKDNINDWAEMDFASSTRAAQDSTRWKEVDVKTSVVTKRPRKVME